MILIYQDLVYHVLSPIIILQPNFVHRAAKKWPWDEKLNKGFFRGSRTSSERDPLILLSRSNPDLVDAEYTKNQAWRSDAVSLANLKNISVIEFCTSL